MKTLPFNILLFLSYSLFTNTFSYAFSDDKNEFKIDLHSQYYLETKYDSIEPANDSIADKKSFLLGKVVYNASRMVTRDLERGNLILASSLISSFHDPINCFTY